MVIAENPQNGEAHTACSGIKEFHTSKQPVTGSANARSDAIIVSEQTVNFMNYPSENEKASCLICDNSGFLDSELLSSDQQSERLVIGRLHFICGLYSHQVKVIDLDKRTFEAKANFKPCIQKVDTSQEESQNETQYCFYCSKPVDIEGWACSEPGCKHSTHLYCALVQRARAKTLTKHLPVQPIQEVTVSNELKPRTLDSDHPDWRNYDHGSQNYKHVTWLEQVEDARSYWYLPFGTGPQNAQFQEQLRTIRRDVHIEAIMAETLKNSAQLLTDLKIQVSDVESRTHAYASPLVFLERGSKNFFSRTDFNSRSSSPLPADQNRILTASPDSELVPDIEINRRPPSLRPDGVCCPTHFSQSASFYCYCGTKQEINEVEEFESVYCEDCGTWFHQKCVGISAKEDVPDVWQCQKCHDLGNIVSDFPAFLETLVNSIYPYDQGENKDRIQKNSIPYPSLRWRNLLVRDYMIVLNLIWKWKDLISPLAVSCLQELMPFTLEGLFGGESAPDNGDQSEVVSHSTVYTEATQVQTLAWLELALSDIVRTKIKNMFSSSFEEDQTNSGINISYLQETRRKLAQLIKNLELSLKNQLDQNAALTTHLSSTQMRPKSPADLENGTNNLGLQTDQPSLQKHISDREDLGSRGMPSMTLQHTVSLGPDAVGRQAAAWQTPAESMQLDTEVPQSSPRIPYRVVRESSNTTGTAFGALQKLNTKYLEPFSKLFFSYQKKTGWNIDEATEFLQKVQASGLMAGTRLEQSLQEVLSRSEQLIQEIGHHLQVFMESLHESQLLEVDLHRVQELSLHNSLFRAPRFLAEPLIVKTIVFQTGETLSKHYHTTVKKLSDPKDLPVGLKSNLLSAFFDFAQCSKDLQEFIKVIKSMRHWEQSVVDLQRRLEALQTIEVEELLKTPNWEHRIVKAQELEELINLENKEFASLKEKYPFFKRMTEVNLQSKFFPRIEAKTRSNSEVLSVLDVPAADLGRSGIVNELGSEETKYHLDIPSFEAVFQEFIKKGVPLSPECVSAIDRECIRYKTDLFWKGAIKMTSEELGELVAALSKVASGSEDLKRIENLKKLEKIIDIVSDTDYPMNIEESHRIQRLREHNDILNTHAVLGPVKLKIELLLKTVSETEGLRQTLMRNTKTGSLQGGVESQRWLEHFWTNFVDVEVDEALVSQIEWENLTFLSKRLLLKNPHLQFFPRLKKFVDKVYLGLALHLSHNFQPSEKAEIKHLVLIQAILDSAKPQTVQITNQLYLKRLEGLSGLLRGVVALLHSQKTLSLPDFRSQVEDLLERRSKMRGIPNHPRSSIRHLTQLLDEADVLGRLLRRVKVFRSDDINRKNFKLYRMMAEIVRNNTLARLPLKQAEVASKDVKEFLRYFKEIEECSQKVEAIRSQASEVHTAVQAKLANRISLSLSSCVPLILELPPIESYEDLLKKIEKYPFLEDLASELKSKLDEADSVLKHSEDPKHYTKFIGGLADMKSESLRREFQLYLIYFLTRRLKGLWFVSRELKTFLKVLFVCNKIASLAYSYLTLKSLQTAYQELQEHPFFDEDVKNGIPYKEYFSIIEERILEAHRLQTRLNELWNDPQTTLDVWIQYLGVLGGSTVAVIDLETLLQNEPSQKQAIELHSKALKIWQTATPDSPIPFGWKQFFPSTFEGRFFTPESSDMGSEDEVVFVQYGTYSNCWQAVSLLLSVMAALYRLEKSNGLDSLCLQVSAWIARLSRTDILLSKLLSPVVQQWLDSFVSSNGGFGAFQSSSSSSSPHRRATGNKLVNPRLFVHKKDKHVEESSTTTRKDKKSNSFSEVGYPGDLASAIAGKRVDRASSAEHPEDQSIQNRSIGLRGSKSRKSSESMGSRFSNSGLGKRKAGSSQRRGGKGPRKLPGRTNQQVQSKIEEEGSLADPSEDRQGSGHDENAIPGYDNLGSSMGNNTDRGASRHLIKKKGQKSQGEIGDTAASKTGHQPGDLDDSRDKATSKKSKGSVFLQPSSIIFKGEPLDDKGCELSLFLNSSTKKWLSKLQSNPHSSLHLEIGEKPELEGLTRKFYEDSKNKSSGFLQGQMVVSNKELKNRLLLHDWWFSDDLASGRLWITRHRLDKKQPNPATLFSDSKGTLQSNAWSIIIELRSSQNASLAGVSDQGLSGGQQSSPKGGDGGQEQAANSKQKNQTAVQPTRRQSERKKASKAI